MPGAYHVLLLLIPTHTLILIYSIYKMKLMKTFIYKGCKKSTAATHYYNSTKNQITLAAIQFYQVKFHQA